LPAFISYLKVATYALWSNQNPFYKGVLEIQFTKLNESVVMAREKKWLRF